MIPTTFLRTTKEQKLRPLRISYIDIVTAGTAET
jgi:hypothetical protein